MLKKRKAIALLITMFLIIAITLSIGIGLKYVNKASNEVESENFMLQTSVVLDDVLAILKTSNELESIVKNKSKEAFYDLLSKPSFISFDTPAINISVEIKSARTKINPNILIKDKNEVNQEMADALNLYFSNYDINAAYVDMMLDMMSGAKEDLSYNSEIFYDKTDLFRDYIVSKKHLSEIDDFYEKTFHDNNLKNINFDNLFYFSSDKNIRIDLNYATADVWELMLGCTKERAQTIASGAGTWNNIDNTNLQDDEKDALSKFNTSYFEPYLEVVVNIMNSNNIAKVRFEYDMKTKEGTNFSYDI